MDLYAVTDLILISLGFIVFMIRRNVTASFLFVEWFLSIALANTLYFLNVENSIKFVSGPLVPIFLFMIFSLYFKVKPVKGLMYTYLAFWFISFMNYLSHLLDKEILNGLLMIDLNWFTPSTYFAFTVTIMLIQLYIAFKLDRRGNFSRSDCDNTLHSKRYLNGNRYARL